MAVVIVEEEKQMHWLSMSSHRWSLGPASLAPTWLYPWGRHDDHWQVNTGDSSFYSSVDNGTVHRARGPGWEDGHGFGFGHVILAML